MLPVKALAYVTCVAYDLCIVKATHCKYVNLVKDMEMCRLGTKGIYKILNHNCLSKRLIKIEMLFHQNTALVWAFIRGIRKLPLQNL